MALLKMLAALWMLVSGVAMAAPCAEYVNASGSERYVFDADGTGSFYTGYGGEKATISARFQHYRQGNAVLVRNVENGFMHHFVLGRQGAELTEKGGDRLKARMPYRCQAVESVRSSVSPAACAPGQEANCCASGDAAACEGLPPAAAGRRAALESACKHSPQACLLLIKDDEQEASPKKDLADIFSSMYATRKPLPSSRLDAVEAMCTRHRTPELCRKAIDQLWVAQRREAAVRLLEQSCTAGLDESRCKNLPQLQSLRLSSALTSPRELPCGEFESSGPALLSTLEFGNRGRVQIGFGSSPTARIEDGTIRIRHDKGGDFVFAMLDESTLLGMDDFTSMAVFKRDKAPAQSCTPPIKYAETALSTSCVLGQDPQACCAAGDTQGCNRLGNMAALANRWREAAGHFAKVCAAKVRVGCENWVNTVGHTGDMEGVERGLRSLCEKDGTGTHVACDVLENGELAKQGMYQAFGKAMMDAANKGKSGSVRRR